MKKPRENPYINAYSDIDDATEHPETYSTPDLRRIIRDAYNVYEYGNKSKDWYEQVKRICNSEITRRGENPE